MYFFNYQSNLKPYSKYFKFTKEKYSFSLLYSGVLVFIKKKKNVWPK